MPVYRKVDLAVHADRRVRALRGPNPNPHTLYFAILAGPRSTAIPGVAVARPAVFADDHRWPLDGTEQAIAEGLARPTEGLAKGLIQYDFDTGLAWIPGALDLESSKPEGPNALRHWGADFAALPGCALRDEIGLELWKRAQSWGAGYVAAYRAKFPPPVLKPLASPTEGVPEGSATPAEPLAEGLQEKSAVTVTVAVTDPDTLSRAPTRVDARDLRTTEPGDWATARDLWAEQEAARERLRAGVDPTMRPLGLLPGSTQLQPIVDLLREGLPESELRVVIAVFEAEALESGSGEYFNGQTNWRPEQVNRARSMEPSAFTRAARRGTRRAGGKSPADLMAEADELEGKERASR